MDGAAATLETEPAPGRPPPVLRLRGVSKRFSGIVALAGVDFELYPGEVHALCGENGAGKSTLIKLLSGLHPAGSFSGEYEAHGAPANFGSLRDAARAGIAVIYQELVLVESMSVAENLFLGREPRGGPLGLFIDAARLHAEAQLVVARVGLKLAPQRLVSTLGVGEKQLLEIAKALDQTARRAGERSLPTTGRPTAQVLILDEPTAALSERETAILLGLLATLRAQGVAILYISHKLDEVFALADRVTVLRDGRSVFCAARAATTPAEVIRHMVGRELAELYPRRPASPLPSTMPDAPPTAPPKATPDATPTAPSSAPPKSMPDATPTAPPTATSSAPPRATPSAPPSAMTDTARPSAAPLLQVRGLTIAPRPGAPPRLRELSFAVRPGEVVGVYGLMGAGRSELLLHLFGAWGARLHGEVELAGEPLSAPGSPAESLRRGLVLVGEERRRQGLVMDASIQFNLSLASLGALLRAGFVDAERETRRNRAIAARLRIKAPTLGVPVRRLSGGNQQKVVLGRALLTAPKVVLLDEPTRGIDVGAKLEIYELVNELAAAGLAVLLVSSELPELLGLSDRVLVLGGGRLRGDFPRHAATPEALLHAALPSPSSESPRPPAPASGQPEEPR